MELGERIRAARLEAGLSQRQLCGEEITRNMLSLIENGSARPSMDTLRYLAERLGKSVSFFLEEQAVTSPNQACMEKARIRWRDSDVRGTLEALEDFRKPDETFEQERGLLCFLALLAMAEQALREERLPYARSLLERAAQENSIYIHPALTRQRVVLLGQAGQAVEPDDDEILLVRARVALEGGDPDRCLEILTAARERTDPQWQLLAGLACLGQQDYAAAAEHLTAAEQKFPKQTIPQLEICHRELKDFQKAYEYACKGRTL